MSRYRLTSVPLEQYNSSVRQLNAAITRAEALDAETATLRAENEQLRRERGAIRNETLEERSDMEALAEAAFKAGRSRSSFAQEAESAYDEIADTAIRNLKEPSDD
jgi:cell division protein FtsB